MLHVVNITESLAELRVIILNMIKQLSASFYGYWNSPFLKKPLGDTEFLEHLSFYTKM
jgi:hypothetical protein